MEPTPEHCPGTESEEAGKASACSGCPNQQLCASGKAKGPDPDLPAIEQKMAQVKKKILILSGKGGVGKSTFTTNLARGLAAYRMAEATPPKQSDGDMDSGSDDHSANIEGDEDDVSGFEVGVLDVDICGPSTLKMFDVEKEEVHSSSSGWSPVFVGDNISLMSIGFLLPSDDDAVIWRGPKKNGLIKRFLKDVDWGALDFLLVDTPPGTSDEHLSIVQLLQTSGIDGCIIVTTPQEVALQDVRKEISFCKKVKLPILGVVENMAGFICPSCKKSSDVFRATTGGAKAMAQEMGVDYLGSIGIDPRIGMSCDRGDSIFEEYPDSVVVSQYNAIIAEIIQHLQ